MKYIVVISFDLEDPDDIGDVLIEINPPRLRGFSGKVRVAIDPVATQIEEWLDV